MFQKFNEKDWPVSKWKDEFGMTLLMNMVISAEEKMTNHSKHMRQLIELIIKEEYFDDDYINHKADYDLSVQFQMQHYQGIQKQTKKKNTVIVPGQEIRLKKVKKTNDDEQITGKMRDDQIKMISKHKVQLILAFGTDKEERIEKRIMVTCRLKETLQLEEFSVQVKEDRLCHLGENEPLITDSISRISEKKIENVTQEAIPEHFDTQSIITNESNENQFLAKGKMLQYSESISTKLVNTPECLQAISKHFSRKTTLLLLASKTKSWNIVRAILHLSPEKYPSLFTKEGGIQSKHPLYHQDESKSNCLHLALEDKQLDLCQLIIGNVDQYTLKTMPVVDGKTVLKVIILNNKAYIISYNL